MPPVILAIVAALALGPQTSRAPERAIAEIEAGRSTTPLIGESSADGNVRVTFLARRSGARVPRIVSDVTGWGERLDGTFDFTVGRMTRVGRTDWYALQATVAPRARIEYLIAYAADDYRLDPHNPRQSPGPRLGGARASEFVMPGYEAPGEFADPPVSPAGLLTEASIVSKALRTPCRVSVYTPPGYRQNAQYPMAVFLTARAAQVSRVLDWLIAHGTIEPVVAVFAGVDLRREADDRGASARTFLSRELLAWASSQYAVTGSAGKRAIIGISYGAKAALDAALSSEGFDNLGLLIPGRRIGRGDLDAIRARRGRRLRVAILAGRYDSANLATARRVRDALAAAGHIVDYTEVPEGHSAVTWTTNLRAVLGSLFAPARD